MIRFTLFLFLLFTVSWKLQAQEAKVVPVNWDIRIERLNDTAYIVFYGEIPHGQYIYACDFQCEIGPFPASIVEPVAQGGAFTGPLRSPGAVVTYDDIFECNIFSYKEKASFRQAIRVDTGHADFSGALEYQVCLEDGMCVLQRKEFSLHAH